MLAKFLFHITVSFSVLVYLPNGITLLLISLSISVSFLLCVSSSPLLLGHMQTIDSFVSESMEALSTRPENMEDIAAAGGTYSQILAHKPDVRKTHCLTLTRNLWYTVT